MKPFVIIELDKPRKMRIGTNEMILIEELTGKPVQNMDLSKVGLKDIRSLLYASLSTEDPTLTLADVGNMMDACGDYKMIGEKIGEAIEIGFGNSKNAQAAAKKLSHGTGKRR